jgi:hypothetical protein
MEFFEWRIGPLSSAFVRFVQYSLSRADRRGEHTPFVWTASFCRPCRSIETEKNCVSQEWSGRRSDGSAGPFKDVTAARAPNIAFTFLTTIISSIGLICRTKILHFESLARPRETRRSKRAEANHLSTFLCLKHRQIARASNRHVFGACTMEYLPFLDRVIRQRHDSTRRC